MISKIALTPRKGFVSTFPKDFKLQYSADKKIWQDIAGQSYTDYVASDTQLVLSTVPDGFTVHLTDSSDQAVISLDGKIVPQATETTIELTFTVSKDGRQVETIRTVTVPAQPILSDTNKTILKYVLDYDVQAQKYVIN